MRTLSLFLCASIAAFTAMPAFAFECTNSGAVAGNAPNDTDDGNAIACGPGTVAGGISSTALGPGATSAGGQSIALGNALSGGGTSIALGFGANSAGEYSQALGFNTYSPGVSSTALGPLAASTGSNSTAIGNSAWASAPNSLVLGSIPGVSSATDYVNVGIGTHAPVEAVDVERSAAAARFQLSSFTSTASEAPQYIQRRARGSSETPTAVQNNDNLGVFSFRGHNGTSMGGSRATITAQAAGTFSGSSTPTRLIFSTTPVGQTTPQSVMVITPDGKVQINGVNLTVPDYVFEEDYELMPLEELKSFIDENGHLPGIASAQQVNEEGLDLAGSQMSQLQKIEELTLYTLQQDQRLADQHAELRHLRSEVQELHAIVERFERLEHRLTTAALASD